MEHLKGKTNKTFLYTHCSVTRLASVYVFQKLARVGLGPFVNAAPAHFHGYCENHFLKRLTSSWGFFDPIPPWNFLYIILRRPYRSDLTQWIFPRRFSQSTTALVRGEINTRASPMKQFSLHCLPSLHMVAAAWCWLSSAPSCYRSLVHLTFINVNWPRRQNLYWQIIHFNGTRPDMQWVRFALVGVALWPRRNAKAVALPCDVTLLNLFNFMNCGRKEQSALIILCDHLVMCALRATHRKIKILAQLRALNLLRLLFLNLICLQFTDR